MNNVLNPGLPPFVLGNIAPGFAELRSNNLGVRLAVCTDELDAVQALRYRVFYNEMGAKADAETVLSARDRDEFDAIADHLLWARVRTALSALTGWFARVPRPSLAGFIRPASTISHSLRNFPGSCWSWGGPARRGNIARAR